MFEELIKGSKFMVGTLSEDQFYCSDPVIFKENSKVTNYFKDIDWKKVYDWYKIQTKNM